MTQVLTATNSQFTPRPCGWCQPKGGACSIIYSSNDPGSPPNSLFPYILPHTAMPTIHPTWLSTFAPTLTPRPNLPHHLTPGSLQSNTTWHPALDKTRLTVCMLYHNKPRQRYSLAFLLLLTSQKNRTQQYNTTGQDFCISKFAVFWLVSLSGFFLENWPMPDMVNDRTFSHCWAQ